MPQPVLGILTLYMNEKKQLEERSIYQKMTIAGKKIGIDLFVFTPEDVDQRKKLINGMFYQVQSNKWTRKWTSFPNLIFDRARLQKSYRFAQLKQFRSRYHSLLFLNRPLGDKWSTYLTLKENSLIRPHLPPTKVFTSPDDVLQMLKREGIVFVKPINGTGGRGIMRIEKCKNPKLYYIQGRDLRRKIIHPQKIHAATLGAKLNVWTANRPYIVQKGIQVKLPDGRVHDYRMLVQKDGSGNWGVTGCAGRVGPQKSVTSNLHGGGIAVGMLKLLEIWIEDEEKIKQVKETAEKLGIEAAKHLEQKYGALCELALDLAIDRYGNVWLLEVNPKPAREVFQLAGEKETYYQAISKPLEYALWLYNQKALKVKRVKKTSTVKERK